MKRRYSGNDRHFGPFTLSKHTNEGYQPLGVMLDSGGREDRGDDGCNLKLHAIGYTLICELPQIIQPFRIKHIAESWDAATVERMGRNWYYETFQKEFGFTVSDGSLHVHYGPQTWDSRTTKSKVYFLPWKQWRHVRFSLYGSSGEHFWTQFERDRKSGFREQLDAENAAPKVRFAILDNDGQEIEATTHIEEREWRFGEGWFKWLSLFRRAKIRRSLSIAFSAEVGPEKGSWKGGLMGTSIEMLPGELHEDAFRRYCEQEHRSKHRQYRVSFIGKVAA